MASKNFILIAFQRLPAQNTPLFSFEIMKNNDDGDDGKVIVKLIGQRSKSKSQRERRNRRDERGRKIERLGE